MSCGTKLRSHDNYELAESLEREGEYGIASDVRRGRCLDSSRLRKAEYALKRQGLERRWDYREESCSCSGEDY